MTNSRSAFEAAGQRYIQALERIGWPVHAFRFAEKASQPAHAGGNELSRRYERRAERTNDSQVSAVYKSLAAEAALSTGNPGMDSKAAKTTALMQSYASELRRVGYPVDDAVIKAVAKDNRLLFTFTIGDPAQEQAQAEAEKFEKSADRTTDRQIARLYREKARDIRKKMEGMTI